MISTSFLGAISFTFVFSSGFLEKMEAAFELGVKVIVVAASYHEDEEKEVETIKKLRDRMNP